MGKIKLAPSILSADFSKLGEEIITADRAGADYIHIDVMDGCFVPNITYGAPVMKCVRGCTDKIFDVHMMVQNPDALIPDFVKAGADIIVVHAEACIHLHRTLQLIHSFGIKAGVALNPATPLSVLDYVLDDVDMITIMSVNPGFGGQSYIPAVTGKIRELRSILNERGLDTDIEVDGGVDTKNLAMLIEAGTTVLVSGSKIFSGDITENIHQFKKIMSEYNY
ncbi:MAG: ribulose-phosphate 3-epimerase [Coprococcus sp.]